MSTAARTIVIDVGCADQGHDNSIRKLVDRFHPGMLYGFDPAEAMGQAYMVEETSVFVNPTAWGSAAWITDGYVGYIAEGDRSRVVDETESSAVAPCFDLARFIEALAEPEIILKLDCEGAEVPLLDHLRLSGADKQLSLILVEYHCQNCGGGGGWHAPDCPSPRFPPRQVLACATELWE